MAPSEEDGSVEEKENNNKKRSKSAIATAWLTFYNITMTAGWLVLAVAMARFYIQKGNHRGLYKSISRTLKFFQTFALLEVVHCAVGIVRTSVIVTGVQVCSRIFMVWFVTNSIKQVISHSTWKLVIGSAYKLVGCTGQWQEASPSFLQTCWLMYTCVVYFIPTTFPIFPLSADCYRKIQNEESVVLFLVVWTVTEITRYSFYTFSLLNHLPYFIKWARCRGDVDEWAHLIGRLSCFCWLASRSDWRTEALTLK